MKLPFRHSVFNVVITTAAKAIAVALIALPAGLFAETKNEEAKPTLLKVIPDAVYANETDFLCPLYNVTVVGENLPAGDALKVFVNDRQLKVVQLKADEDKPPLKAAGGTAPEAYVKNPGDGSQFDLWINRLAFSGRVELRVGTDPASSPTATPSPTTSPSPATTSAKPAASPPVVIKSGSKPLTLAKNGNTQTDRRLFRVFVFVVALVILLIPIFLIRKMVKAQIAAESSEETASYNPRSRFQQYLTALFLDRETATYSLSKFQFYIWTAVSVMGYLYLAASRAYVQGVWTFISIPDNLPGIVFISGATGALAVVATNSRGPKGAGDVHPSLADFVCSGGVVAVERVQFLIWTVIGALMFLWLSLCQTPVDILELPKVPDTFLQLMGISSLGYLSGKFARKPGPIINDVSVKLLENYTPPKKNENDNPTKRTATILSIRGRILSPDADFKITYEAKDKTTAAKEVSLTDHFAPVEVKVSETDDQTPKQERTAKKLDLIIDQPTLEWLNGGSKLLISNPDGQTAGWALPRMPKITGDIKAAVVPATTTTPPAPELLKLTITGENLARVATFKIETDVIQKDKLPPEGIKVLVPDEDPPAQFANTLELTISSPASNWKGPGKRKLTIKNSEEMTAEGTYEIKPPPAAPSSPPPAPAGSSAG
jgi:hypothetical protein